MDGLLFLSSLVGIGLLMAWVIMNDRAKADGQSRGLFAIRWRPRDGTADPSARGKASGEATKRRRHRNVPSRRHR